MNHKRQQGLQELLEVCRRLAWRPTHRPAAKKVHMQVLDGLATVCACIYHQPVTLFQALRTSDLAGCRKYTAEQTGIGRQRLGMRGDMSFGDDENMHWGLRMEVGKGQRVRRFMQAMGGQHPGDDLAEDAIGGRRVSHAPCYARRDGNAAVPSFRGDFQAIPLGLMERLGRV